jgi:peroxiredoxin
MKIMLFASYATVATAFKPSFVTLRLSSALRMSSAATSSYAAPVAKKEWMTPIKAGDVVPDVVFKTRTRIDADVENPFDWKDLTSDDLFKGKRIVLFSLPGAFTPTCSATHLPGYEKAYDEMKKLGVDDVYCLSVNDAFVMRQWGLHQGLAEDKTPGSLGFFKVKLLPDGACHFTRGMGMSCMWDTERGFGERSWRYSAVINDKKIEKIFIEAGENIQNSGPDPFEVSDAETMLSYLKSKN